MSANLAIMYSTTVPESSSAPSYVNSARSQDSRPRMSWSRMEWGDVSRCSRSCGTMGMNLLLDSVFMRDARRVLVCRSARVNKGPA